MDLNLREDDVQFVARAAFAKSWAEHSRRHGHRHDDNPWYPGIPCVECREVMAVECYYFCSEACRDRFEQRTFDTYTNIKRPDGSL